MRTPTTAPSVVAHRGASGEAPENTLAAVSRAIARGADRVEIDVQRTKDGALILMHDTTLARTTDARRVFPRRGPWLVADFTLSEVARLDAGSWWSRQYAGERVPTLDEVVLLLRPTSVGVHLELKATGLHPGLALDVAHALRAVPGYVEEAVAARRLTVQSFDHRAAQHHRHLEPTIPVGALGTPAVADLGAVATWAAEVNPVHWSVGAHYVQAVRRHGMACHVWTVDRSTHLRRALRLGVDGIITNHPAVLRQMLMQAALT